MKRFMLLTTSLICSGFAINAQAQTAGFDEIMVTSQKRSQSVQDVPLAISVVSAGDIERVQAATIQDLQYSTPNVTIQGQDPTNLAFGVRGIADRSRNPGYENRIGVYIDGVWVGRSVGANALTLDVENIEILRGPQGTLFGKNTVSGAINITTRKPSEEFGAFARGQLGNYGLVSGTAGIDLPVSDSLRTKLTLSKRERDGFTNDVATDVNYGNTDEFAARFGAELDVSPSTTASLAVDFSENDFKPLIAESTADAAAPEIYEVSLDAVGQAYTRSQGAALTVTHAFDNGYELTSITGLRSTTRKVTDVDEDYSSLPAATTEFVTEQADNISQEFRIASPEFDRFDYVAGLYYLNQDIEGSAQARALLAALNPAFPAVYRSVTHEETLEAETIAAFIHGNYDLTDQLQMTAGLRYTDESKDFDYVIDDRIGLFTSGSLVDSRSESDLSYSASLNWFATDDIMTYARYSKAFKSGGWNADFIANIEALPFDDEKVDAFELGYKATLFDSRLRLNAAAFLQKHKDFQVFSFAQLANGGTQLTVTNAGEVTSKGFEIDANIIVNENLRLFANWGYTDAEFDEFKDGGGPGVDFDGNVPSEAPKNSLSFGADLNYPVANGEFVAQADFSYRDEYFSNPNNEAVNLNESASFLNGRIGYEPNNNAWGVYLWGKNLTDEVTQLYNSRSFLGVPRSTYSDPLTYGVELRVNFGSAKN